MVLIGMTVTGGPAPPWPFWAQGPVQIGARQASQSDSDTLFQATFARKVSLTAMF